MLNSIPSQKETNSYCRKFEKMLLVVHLSFLHVKQSLTKLSFGNRRAYANLSSGLMLANFTHNRCVNRCRPVFIRVGMFIQKPIDLLLVKTKPLALKILSYLVFNEKGQNVKLKVSIQQADRKKISLLQCWLILFSLQDCVWSHGLLLSLVSWTRDTSISHWKRYSTC